MKKVIVIGAGFSGISAASNLAAQGFEVTVLEKHNRPGGRARSFSSGGFTFDMGPSWYWMPDVFEDYFGCFGKKPSDYYDLIRLDPSYRIFFSKDEIIDLPASYQGLRDLFESYEHGAGKKLDVFLSEAKRKYEIGMKDVVYKPGLSLKEFIDPVVASNIIKLNIFQSFNGYTRKFFRHPHLLQILEFPILFLGGTGKTTPALYSLMNYGDMALGTWYPRGGMYRVIQGMVTLAEELGVRFKYNTTVDYLPVRNGRITEVISGKDAYPADIIVSSADYHHTESSLIPEKSRSYSEKYWNGRTMSPSSLIFFLGLNKPLEKFLHHTLFFDEDFSKHADSIYKHPEWPEKPSLYFSNTSKTDATAAPEGHESLMVLIPVAPGLNDTEGIRERYFNITLDRIQRLTGHNLLHNIVFKKSYALQDFKEDYHSYKGNAYGLANTLFQTAFLKPKMKSRNIRNLYYTGQLTVPGPGVPPALISGKVAADLISKNAGK